MEISKTILITGGIGDFLAIESFITNEQKNMLQGIFYATRATKSIMELMACVPGSYPSLQQQIPLWEDFSKFFAFHHKEEVIHALARIRGKTNMVEKNQRLRWLRLLNNVQDYSIFKLFPKIRIKPYAGSSFLNNTIADISRFGLPENYYIICPFSTDKRDSNREFKRKEWQAVNSILNFKGLKGVVVNKGDDVVPQFSSLINLSNQTSLAEAIEVLKKAKGYIGIDSWLSVLAPKIFPNSNILIKSTNQHCYLHKEIYFAPKRNFDFLKSDLSPY